MKNNFLVDEPYLDTYFRVAQYFVHVMADKDLDMEQYYMTELIDGVGDGLGVGGEQRWCKYITDNFWWEFDGVDWGKTDLDYLEELNKFICKELRNPTYPYFKVVKKYQP